MRDNRVHQVVAVPRGDERALWRMNGLPPFYVVWVNAEDFAFAARRADVEETKHEIHEWYTDGACRCHQPGCQSGRDRVLCPENTFEKFDFGVTRIGLRWEDEAAFDAFRDWYEEGVEPATTTIVEHLGGANPERAWLDLHLVVQRVVQIRHEELRRERELAQAYARRFGWSA